MKQFFTLLLFCSIALNAGAQNNDSLILRKIFTYCLEEGKSYEWLDYLSNKIGPRLSGSTGAEKAVAWAKLAMEAEGHGTVKLQEVMVPHWERGSVQELTAFSGNEKQSLRICSLGGSVPTPDNGLRANVVEVRNFEELAFFGKEKLQGKIVFYNVPMKQYHYHTFNAYGESGKYRYRGAQEAAKYGAIASITRSLTLSLDDYPHTGAMGYADSIPKIPACAISTKGAEELSKMIKLNANTEVSIKMDCNTFPDVQSYNVIAEIKGSVFPNEIIVVGGHLDSWDVGEGAHDDGAGCVQSLEVIRTIKALNLKPKRTIRCIFYVNEENGNMGGKTYGAYAKNNKSEKPIAALESDAGGFSPRGFNIDTTFLAHKKFDELVELMSYYGVYKFEVGHGGTDIGPLEAAGTKLFGLSPDSQRYMDLHHTDNDVFEQVNKRELHMGASVMAMLCWWLSEYGVQ